MHSVVILLLLTSCSFFAGEKIHSAKGSYQFNQLPSSWKNITPTQGDYIFYGPHGSSLMLQSFCDEFQSASLTNLAQTTFNSLDKATITKKEEFMLEERNALRSEGEAWLDGKKVKITLINTRRDNCYYDFLEVLPHQDSPTIIDHLIKGLRFK